MKIGILSDIHGNYDALISVLNNMREIGVEELIISGDLVGYYYRVDLVLKALREWKWITCMGNHELIYLKWQNATIEDREIIKKKYGSSYEQADFLLNKEQKEFLNNLSHPIKHEIEGYRFLVCHGSPENINQYIYPDNSNILKIFQKYVNEVDVVILGHTHFQAKWTIDSLNIINPGSVGQPRSGTYNPRTKKDKLRAEWVLFDLKIKQFDFRTTFYDGSNLIEQVEKLDSDYAFLKNVLLRGLD